MTLLAFVLIAYGITNILCFGRILSWLRNGIDRLRVRTISDFVRCPMCVGFWVGFVVSVTGYGVTHPFFDASIASGGSSLLHAASVYLCEEC